MRSTVFIVAGGLSLSNFDFSKLRKEDTIVVNKSILDVPNPNFFITVDYTFLRKIDIDLLKSVNTTKIFVADLHYPFLEEIGGRIVDTRFDLVYDLNLFDVIIKSRRADGIGYTFHDFRTGINSGFCALQLAIILGYKRIALLGMDLNTKGKTHYHTGYGDSEAIFKERLKLYYDYFCTGLSLLNFDDATDKEIEVISCSKDSRLNHIINYKSFEEVTND